MPLSSVRRWLAALAVAFATTRRARSRPVVMRISHQVPPAHHMTKLLEGFAADVKQRTNGQVEVQLYGSEQLAKAAENFPQVARGTIEAAMSVNFQWGTTIPEMSATLIPYAMGDLERIKRFPTSEARRYLDDKLAQRGVKSVAWLYITRETIVTSGKKPIVALDDFKGVKIRGLNTLTDNALTAVGASPSAMPGLGGLPGAAVGRARRRPHRPFRRLQPQVLRGAEVRHRRPDLHDLLPHVREPGVVEQALARASAGDRGGGGQGRAGRDRRDRADGGGRAEGPRAARA